MYLSRTHAMNKASVKSKIITNTVGLATTSSWMYLYHNRTLKNIKKALALADNTTYTKPKRYT